MYASLLRISGALHLGIFEHPAKTYFFSNELGKSAVVHVWIDDSWFMGDLEI